MKTHDLAKALTTLGKILRSGPNTELEDLNLDLQQKEKDSVNKDSFNTISFSSFVAFSSYSKRQWLDVVKEYNLPLNIPPTDSARDVMGKIMKYFNDSEEARRMLLDSVSKENKKGSPELLKALSTLLRL